MRNQEPLDAGLFYLAMKKQSLLKGLFRLEKQAGSLHECTIINEARTPFISEA